MLYLNCKLLALATDIDSNLTLTSVVFELTPRPASNGAMANLTLTSVVFEFCF